MFFKSCNCNSSIATRVGFAIIFCMNSMLAWLMRTPLVYKKLEEWSKGYLSMDCEGGKCYGVLAVHRICFSLCLLHTILSLLLIGVKDTKSKRAAIQNGFWGPKVLLWLVLTGTSFFIPNGFFMFWGNYVSLLGATLFIILGLVLLIDFAHSWSETCLENWENSPTGSNMWQWVLISSTAALYAAAITLTGIMYAFFAKDGCSLNQFFISFNLALGIIITIMAIHPAVQEANPRSGLAQSGMVAAYCSYLIMSAVGNNTSGGPQCNPIHNRDPGSADTTHRSTIVLGAIFTFLAIAYSTSRAATQSRALVGKSSRKAAIALPTNGSDGDSLFDTSRVGLVTTQPGPKKDTPRYQALLAAVEAGAIPASALDEDDEQDSDDEQDVTGEERDDERTGTKYNYSWFHIIFVMGAMYVAELLTDWHVIRATTPTSEFEQDVYIGRSAVAMWMRVVSSWVCIALYGWSLLAPVVMPDRFGDI
ncbi:hypothetical protein FRB94_005434 [Tulasnella sp. JGI-2019a]|nr:hypothetical protein FRB93_006166 [Tulasnella sp. JGI-2019a]KAG9000421.1 hypothetical protein FRB94_005434 [Tulasnella sp. JGI-2019a]KAG9028324.1 hypothetical protein FRB95_006597 [Tulasnella sp. JGI-2019a]